MFSGDIELQLHHLKYGQVTALRALRQKMKNKICTENTLIFVKGFTCFAVPGSLVDRFSMCYHP